MKALLFGLFKPFLPFPLSRPQFCVADLPPVAAVSGTHGTYGPDCPMEWGGHRDTVPTDLSLPGLGYICDSICTALPGLGRSGFFLNLCLIFQLLSRAELPSRVSLEQERGLFIPDWIFWLKFVFLLRWFSCCILWRRSGWKPKGGKIWAYLKMLRLSETRSNRRRVVKN